MKPLKIAYNKVLIIEFGATNTIGAGFTDYERKVYLVQLGFCAFVIAEVFDPDAFIRQWEFDQEMDRQAELGAFESKERVWQKIKEKLNL